MRNCLIMGSGRSGTSLMAGILYHAGYFLGDDLYPARECNPLGFFENDFINGINESILKEFDYDKLLETSPVFTKRYSPFHPGEGHRWLTIIPEEIKIDHCTQMIEDKIRVATNIPNFAYKDPRFNYTLNIWNRMVMNDVLYICMFRRPDITVGSILKECNDAGYLADFYIDPELAYRQWLNSYNHVLKNLSTISTDRVMFIHYEQLLEGSIIRDLSGKLEIGIDTSFIVKELNRSKPVGKIPSDVLKMYDDLCTLSGFCS